MDLNTLGWNDFFAQSFAAYQNQGYLAARVISQHKNLYRLFSELGELTGQVSGKFNFQAEKLADFPAVGDWTVITPSGVNTAIIHAVLPRQTKFSRKTAGSITEEQIVSANIDTVFIVTALNKDFNLRRIERYLTLVWESGANPVIILSKADLCQDVEQKISDVEDIALGIPVFAVSSLEKSGLDNLLPYLSKGKSIALLGSSGAGKSTLLNSIIGQEIAKVNQIRQADDKGRHTTTHRELFLLPQGGIIIDTPGMRELQLWSSDEGFKDTFEDIDTLAAQCRFADCRHESEPGCAVKKALEEGRLDAKRLENYQKMKKELSYLSDRQDYLARKENLFKQYAVINKKNNKQKKR